ncbi:MAG: hypothetical protein JKY83_07655 [Rhizobiaceae bacterium]|nr:hypothetical protein [Rhizobiaceae bacterium]
MAERPYRLWVLGPRQLTWWVATLFMIGSALFALGCLLYLGAVEHELTLDGVFFVGSLFFTSAAYCQFHQSISGNKIAFYSALNQFIGTLMFNMNTFDAFFNLGWIEQDLLVWTPNILGSILFLISGILAMKNLCNKWWCWNFQNIDWWMGVINFLGCVAFLLSAAFSFIMPVPTPTAYATFATLFTLLGACCFFTSAFLMRLGTPAR